jgi:hypothetical protein
MADEKMEPGNRDDRMEAMLDSLLQSYSDEQPRPGFETRMLANLRAHGSRKSVRWNTRWLWSISGAAAAAVLFTVWLWQVLRLPEPPAVAFHALPPAITAPSIEPPASRRHDEIRPVRPNEPVAVADVRQEVFPSRTPLSEQELTLLRYLKGTPKEEVIAQSRPDPPPPPDDGDLLQPHSQQFRRPESFNTR